MANSTNKLALVSDPKRMGEAIRSIRERKQLSQRDLAESLGVSQALISRAEVGERQLPLQALERLALVHGVDVGDLFPPVDAADAVAQAYAAWAAYEKVRG